MNNENLPQKINENIFVKIKNWFFKFLKKNNSNETCDVTENQKENNDFKDNIKVENNDNILRLQEKLKENQINVSELTDKELDEMINLYKKQIEEKKIKLKQYRMKIA